MGFHLIDYYRLSVWPQFGACDENRANPIHRVTTAMATLDPRFPPRRRGSRGFSLLDSPKNTR